MQEVLENSALKQGFKKMSTSQESLEKLFHLAYFLPKYGQPYSQFSQLSSKHVNLASVITKINLVPNSLVSSANIYLRIPLKVRLYKAILLPFLVMEIQILLLLTKKTFLYCLWMRIRSSQYFYFFIINTKQVQMLMALWRLLKLLSVFMTCIIFCK